MKSIISRLLPVMLVINIVGMILIAGTGSVLSGNAINDQSLGRISETTLRKSAHIDNWLSNHVNYINAISTGFASFPDISPDNIMPALKAHDEANADYFCVYAGYPDGIGVFSDEWEPNYDEWRANERPWYIGALAAAGTPYITDLYVDADTGDVCLTFSKTIIQNGAVTGVIAIDMLTNVLNDVVDSIDVGKDSYAFLTDGSGNILVHPDRSLHPAADSDGDTVFQNLANIESELFAGIRGVNMHNGASSRRGSPDGIMRY